MTKKSLHFLFLAFFAPLFSCTTVADKDSRTLAHIPTINIDLKRPTDIPNFARFHYIKPVLRIPYTRIFNPPKTVVQGQENLIFSYGTFATYEKHDDELPKPPKSLINIVKQPANGFLEIREVANLNDGERQLRLYKQGWRVLTPSSSNKLASASDSEPKHSTNYQHDVLHEFRLYYTPGNSFQHADEFVVEMPADEAKSQLVRYLITHQKPIPDSTVTRRIN